MSEIFSILKMIDILKINGTNGKIVDTKTFHENDKPIMTMLNIEKYGAIVAGGAARCWYTGQPVNGNDIDIWFPTVAKHHEMASSMNQNKHFILEHMSANAVTYKSLTPELYKTVQLITTPFPSPQKLLESFDITVCQCATDGNQWWVGKRFIEDLNSKRLRFERFTKNSVRRFFKYYSYGFEPDDETIDALMSDKKVIHVCDGSIEDYGDF
jgi:hypothetical protein